MYGYDGSILYVYIMCVSLGKSLTQPPCMGTMGPHYVCIICVICLNCSMCRRKCAGHFCLWQTERQWEKKGTASNHIDQVKYIVLCTSPILYAIRMHDFDSDMTKRETKINVAFHVHSLLQSVFAVYSYPILSQFHVRVGGGMEPGLCPGIGTELCARVERDAVQPPDSLSLRWCSGGENGWQREPRVHPSVSLTVAFIYEQWFSAHMSVFWCSW